MATPNDIREIPLTRGKVAIVDAEDYPSLAEYKWQAAKRRTTFYATRCTGGRKAKAIVLMHRYLLRVQGRDLCVDHINGDGLDNRRENIRVVTYSQNSQNQHAHSGRAGRFLGVTQYVTRRTGLRYRAKIQLAGAYIHVGSFRGEADAARAYDAAALLYYGPYAGTNAKLGLLCHGV